MIRPARNHEPAADAAASVTGAGINGADKKLTYLRAEIAQCAKADLQRPMNYQDFCGARWVVKYRNP